MVLAAHRGSACAAARGSVLRRVCARPNRRQLRLDEQPRYKLGLLREYVEHNGWIGLRAGKTYRGVNLFSWIHNRRTEYKTGEIRDFLIRELEAIPGWSWDPWRDHMKKVADDLRAFVRANGWEAVTVETSVDGVKLSAWCAVRRVEHRKGKLSARLMTALEAIPGWSWEPREEHYAERIAQLPAHVARHGWEGFGIHTIDRHGNPIGKWANHVRAMKRRDGLPRWLVAELDALAGWTWEPRRDRTETSARAIARKSRT